MLTPPQEKFVQTYLAGKNIGEAAASAHIDRRTATRWLKLPAMQEALARENEKRAETTREIITRIYTEALDISCQVVVEIAQDEEAPAASRLKAAQMIQERLLPASVDASSTLPSEDATGPNGIDWSIFTQEELAIILPIFENAEKRAAGIIDMRKKA